MITNRRTSEKLKIIDSDKHARLAPLYLEIIYNLNSKYTTTENGYFQDLVNFKTNKVSPRHSWFEYKQGYAEKLVSTLIEKNNPPKDAYILDPFTGVGTTNLVSQQLGYKSIGFDINPVAILASKVKTRHYSSDLLNKISELIESFVPRLTTKYIPKAKVISSSFEKDVFNQLMYIKGFYESIEDETIQDFLKLAYLSIIERASSRIKDGNGIKIAKNRKKLENVYDFYIDKVRQMLQDAKINNFDQETILINGSMTLSNDFNKISEKIIGLVIFSPPYANCFDYCEVYKLEFWMGGFVNSYSDFDKYRSKALRSHVNSSFSHEFSNLNNNVDLIANLISAHNVWNKNIPDMIRGYFDDMENIIKNMSKVMTKGAKCYIVVANSGYRGVLVPTDLLLAEIAEKNGFQVNNIYIARKIRASSQQMSLLHEGYNKLMRESIIEITI